MQSIRALRLAYVPRQHSLSATVVAAGKTQRLLAVASRPIGAARHGRDWLALPTHQLQVPDRDREQDRDEKQGNERNQCRAPDLGVAAGLPGGSAVECPRESGQADEEVGVGPRRSAQGGSGAGGSRTSARAAMRSRSTRLNRGHRIFVLSSLTRVASQAVAPSLTSWCAPMDHASTGLVRACRCRATDRDGRARNGPTPEGGARVRNAPIQDAARTACALRSGGAECCLCGFAPRRAPVHVRV